MKLLKQLVSIFALLLLPTYVLQASGGTAYPQGEGDEILTVEIKGTDRMQFDVTEIKATAGQTIRISYTTESNLPKVAMAHNVVVLKQGTDVEAFANASAMARDNGYIPVDMEDQIVAATPLAGGGETVEVTFTVPDTPGEYTYICSFPGHYLAGMKGKLVVSSAAGE